MPQMKASLSDLTFNEFSMQLASSSPAPGGGSASAAAGALAAALSAMVANLTVGKKDYEAHDEEMRQVLKAAQELRSRLLELMDRDAEAFNVFMRALQSPKTTEQEKAARRQAMQDALKESSKVPMEIAENCFSIFALARQALRYGNTNAVTDALVSTLLARSAVLGALLNVRINLQSIKDTDFVSAMRTKVDALYEKTLAEEARLLQEFDIR